MLRSFSSLKREGCEICQAGSQRSKRQDKWEGGGNSSYWKTNCSFTITIVSTEKQQQTRLPSWMRQSPITKSSYCVSDILHMMHVVMNNVAPPMGQTAYYWKWSSKHYRWDVWIPLDMISIEPMITEVTWETLTAADSEKRWHWWWLIRLLLWVCADWFTDALLRLFGRNNLRPHWNVTVEPSIRKLPEFGSERSDGTWPECFRASTVSMTIVAEASYEVTDVQTCWQFYFY